ncbi:hypothetical protein IFR05_010687 [Cadophora sp. M221]|nr:hypothetical protein IFR05_010687 [Cadophora sp. M221]
MADISTPVADDVDIHDKSGDAANLDAPAADDTSSASVAGNMSGSGGGGTSTEDERLNGPIKEDFLFLSKFLAREFAKTLTLYRLTTIQMILAIYGDGTKFPPDPKFTEGCGFGAYILVRVVKNRGVMPENKTAFKLLYNTVQNVALSAITDLNKRVLYRAIGILNYPDGSGDDEDDEGDDTEDNKGDSDATQEDPIADGLAESLESVGLENQDKPSDT